jgi:hypothetical protein
MINKKVVNGALHIRYFTCIGGAGPLLAKAVEFSFCGALGT